MGGVLEGVTVVEMAGIGPAPFAAMMLADHGARVVRIEREDRPPVIPPEFDILARGRAETLRLDLRTQAGGDRVRALSAEADALIEGFRPGVMERLGLGPEILCAANPRLVYARMTGWGQDGPLAQAAGHDIDYIALAGALHTYGRAGGPPTPPVNAVGDFGGGGMMLAFAVVAAILSARATGRGKVVDCAMVDGAAILSALTWSLRAAGMWNDERGTNLLDTGRPYYDCYECADGKWLAVGALEPHFFAALEDKLGLTAGQEDPNLRAELTALFRTRSRDAWCALLEGADACVAPVLSLAEAPRHPHNLARGTFRERAGLTEPAPAPRFGEAPAPVKPA